MDAVFAAATIGHGVELNSGNFGRDSEAWKFCLNLVDKVWISGVVQRGIARLYRRTRECCYESEFQLRSPIVISIWAVTNASSVLASFWPEFDASSDD